MGRLLALLGLALCTGSCSGESRQPAGIGQGPAGPAAGLNVVLLVMDTLRADGLSLYGNSRETSPQIDALARTGLVFERAMTQAPWTPPSMASLFTGTYPSVHQVTQSLLGKRRYSVLPDPLLTLPELFQQLGYRTGAVSSQPWIAPETGFGQGFDHFEVVADNSDPHETEKVVREGLRWIDAERGRPFFLYLHTMNPHDPYDPPPPYAEAWWPGPVPASLEGKALSARQIKKLGRRGPSAEELAYLRARYDAQVAYADAALGELVGRLGDWGLLEGTLIIVTSDHGESFLEHGELLHGSHVFNENLHVPLVLSNPRLFPEPVRVARTVQTLDLFPTLVELLGLDPIAQLQGASALADAHPGQALSEGGKEGTKLQDAAWSLVLDPERGVLLHDLREDPAEQRNLAEAHPDVRDAMLARLTELERRSLESPYRAEGEIRGMGPQMVERLRALGYLD